MGTELGDGSGLAAIVTGLAWVRAEAQRVGHEIEVRLQWDGLGYCLHHGDPGYDTDHTGWWGSSCVGPAYSDADLDAVASALVCECTEDRAMEEA